MIGTEEFPPFLYNQDGSLTDPAFNVLDPPLFAFNQPIKDPYMSPPPPCRTKRIDPARYTSLFAVGGDRVNSSPFTAMMNTLWLREHNRVAKELERRNPRWDDERVFQTARNIIIPMFIKIVVEDYINHITPIPFKIKADPSVAWDATWNRPNWMTAEFSLLYRWHALMPDQIEWTGGAIPLGDFTLDNRKLLAVGLDGAITLAASQATNQLGALNTSAALLPVESLSIGQARTNHLARTTRIVWRSAWRPRRRSARSPPTRTSRGCFRTSMARPTGSSSIPGLFAEDRVPDSPLPQLLMTMVAVDAFSQALTNPLLSQHVWKDNPGLTFTDWGLNEIGDTSSLSDVLIRQGRPSGSAPVTMTLPGWSYTKTP